MLTAIFAKSSDGWFADSQGGLPWRGRTSEMKFFNQVTQSGILVAGSVTYDLIIKDNPSGLDGRKMLCLTGDRTRLNANNWSVPDVLGQIAKEDRPGFVIGGIGAFAAFRKYVSRVIVSTIEKPIPSGSREGWIKSPILGDVIPTDSVAVLSSTYMVSNDDGDDFSVEVYSVMRCRFSLDHIFTNARFDEMTVKRLPIDFFNPFIDVKPKGSNSFSRISKSQ